MIDITCRALLFDLDGVLIDSTPAVSRVWSAWAEERGLDPVEVVAYAHGRPSLATVRKHLPAADHEAENREVHRFAHNGSRNGTSGCGRRLGVAQLRRCGSDRPERGINSAPQQLGFDSLP